MTLGETIRETRKAMMLTQKELADRMGISYVNISQIERGERVPKIDTLSRVANALGVSVAFLLGREYSPSIERLRETMPGLQEQTDEDIEKFVHDVNEEEKRLTSVVQASMEEQLGEIAEYLLSLPEDQQKEVLEYVKFKAERNQKPDETILRKALKVPPGTHDDK